MGVFGFGRFWEVGGVVRLEIFVSWNFNWGLGEGENFNYFLVVLVVLSC